MNSEPRLASIADAELSRRRVGGVVVSRHAQRVVLLALARRSDRVAITTRNLAAASDLSERGTRLAAQALEASDLLRVTPGRPNTYTIRWDRLAALPRKVGAPLGVSA